jgi:hypothetical protein
MGLARGAVRPAGGRREEGAPAVASTCLPPHRWRRHSLCFCKQFGGKLWYNPRPGMFNALLMMGTNLVGLVLGVDGVRYFAHELISSWTGTSFSRESLPLPLIEKSACRNLLPAWCLCLSIRRSVAHVRVQVRNAAVSRDLSYR